MHFSVQKPKQSYEIKHHNLIFLEPDHLFCLSVKYTNNVITHTTKFCNEKK